MDTQLLQAFASVAEGGSFSIAAEQMHLTQPAISKRIALLEGQLDCRLFDRVGRQITLTEAGRALLPHAQSVLQEIRTAKRHIQDLRGGVTGVLTMGISHHLGLHRLPPILKKFTRDYPDVRLDIDFLDSEEAYERVLLGEVEMGVITLAPEAKPSLDQITLWRDQLVVTVAPEHPLASVKKPSLSVLSEHRAILPGLNTYTGRIIKELFDAQRLPLDIAMSTNYLETIKMMVAIGLGWSVLPKTLIDSSLRSLALKDVALDGKPLGRDLGVVIHRERSLSNAAGALLQLMKKAADH
ncbi:MAG: LysR family transcriptional regulator [Spongiibacteraceae bacterium]